MKITAIIENNHIREDVCTEHGLSLYIETNNHILLSDAGQSSMLLSNAEVLNIDLTKVDALFLSHGHYDHAGGILPFHHVNKDAVIYMNQAAGGNYYHKSKSTERYIGIDQDILKLPVVRLLEDESRPLKIDDEIEVFAHVTGRYLWPEGNLILKEKTDHGFVQDDFSHEQYLVLKEAEKLILVSGCAHNGILNILEKFREYYHRDPDVVISGFHMMRKEYREQDLALIRQAGEELKKMHTIFYTGHCTGEVAFSILKEIMGDQVQYLHCGDTIEI